MDQGTVGDIPVPADYDKTARLTNHLPPVIATGALLTAVPDGTAMDHGEQLAIFRFRLIMTKTVREGQSYLPPVIRHWYY